MASLLVWAMLVGSLTNYVIAVLAPSFRVELGLTRAEVGLLTTVVVLVAAITSPAAGRLSDRFGAGPAFACLFALAGAATAAMGLAPSYAVLLLAVSFGGLAMALSNPTTNRVISGTDRENRPGWLVGIKQSGGQLSAVVAGFGLPVVVAAAGWRSAALAASLACMAGFFLIPVLRAVPARQESRGAGHESGAAGHEPSAAGSASTGPTTNQDDPSGPVAVRWMLPYGFLMGAGGGAVITYLPLFAHEGLGTSTAVAGGAAGVLGAVGFVARLLWGPITDALRSGTLLLTVLAAASAGSGVLLMVAERHGLWAMWLAVVVFGASGASWNTAAMLLVVRQTPPAMMGQVTGRLVRWMYAGLLFSPLTLGFVVDLTGSYDAAWTASALLGLGSAAIGYTQWLRFDRRTPGHDNSTDAGPVGEGHNASGTDDSPGGTPMIG